MKKYFYSDLVDFELVVGGLDSLKLSLDEKKELIEIAHSNLHHKIVDVVLSELTDTDKKIFLAQLASDDNEKIWKHLNEKVEKIEDKIKLTAETLKKELYKDIEESRG